MSTRLEMVDVDWPMKPRPIVASLVCLQLSLFANGPDRRDRVPLTIEVKQDVEVLVGDVRHEVRGKLYLGLTRETPFVIRRHERFQMIKVDGEGECRIRFRGKTHLLANCPWLDGFSDQQKDIFEVVGPPAGRQKPQ